MCVGRGGGGRQWTMWYKQERPGLGWCLACAWCRDGQGRLGRASPRRAPPCVGGPRVAARSSPCGHACVLQHLRTVRFCSTMPVSSKHLYVCKMKAAVLLMPDRSSVLTSLLKMSTACARRCCGDDIVADAVIIALTACFFTSVIVSEGGILLYSPRMRSDLRNGNSSGNFITGYETISYRSTNAVHRKTRAGQSAQQVPCWAPLPSTSNTRAKALLLEDVLFGQRPTDVARARSLPCRGCKYVGHHCRDT